MILFNDLPLPPSVNHCYAGFHGRRFRSKALKSFLRSAEAWKLTHMGQVLFAERLMRGWLAKGFQIRVDCWFCFEHSRIYTMKGEVKALDAHNYIKPLHDALAEMLRIDDKHFFAGNAEKVTTKSKDEECSIVKLTPMSPTTKTLTLGSFRDTAAGS